MPQRLRPLLVGMACTSTSVGRTWLVPFAACLSLPFHLTQKFLEMRETKAYMAWHLFVFVMC
jgi:putative copper export protein